MVKSRACRSSSSDVPRQATKSNTVRDPSLLEMMTRPVSRSSSSGQNAAFSSFATRRPRRIPLDGTVKSKSCEARPMSMSRTAPPTRYISCSSGTAASVSSRIGIFIFPVESGIYTISIFSLCRCAFAARRTSSGEAPCATTLPRTRATQRPAYREFPGSLISTVSLITTLPHQIRIC